MVKSLYELSRLCIGKARENDCELPPLLAPSSPPPVCRRTSHVLGTYIAEPDVYTGTLAAWLCRAQGEAENPLLLLAQAAYKATVATATASASLPIPKRSHHPLPPPPLFTSPTPHTVRPSARPFEKICLAAKSTPSPFPSAVLLASLPWPGSGTKKWPNRPPNPTPN